MFQNINYSCKNNYYPYQANYNEDQLNQYYQYEDFDQLDENFFNPNIQNYDTFENFYQD